MHKNWFLSIYIQLFKANAIFAEGICDTRVPAYGILCFVPFLVGFTHEM